MASAIFAQWPVAVEDLLNQNQTHETAHLTAIDFTDCTLKGCGGLLRGHEDDDGLVKAPRHAGEGAAVVRVDDEEERPARERVQIAGMKAAGRKEGGKMRRMRLQRASQTDTEPEIWRSFHASRAKSVRGCANSLFAAVPQRGGSAGNWF